MDNYKATIVLWSRADKGNMVQNMFSILCEIIKGGTEILTPLLLAMGGWHQFIL